MLLFVAVCLFFPFRIGAEPLCDNNPASQRHCVDLRLSGISGASHFTTTGGQALEYSFGAPWDENLFTEDLPSQAVVPRFWGDNIAYYTHTREHTWHRRNPQTQEWVASLTVPAWGLNQPYLLYLSSGSLSEGFTIRTDPFGASLAADALAEATAKLARSGDAFRYPLSDTVWDMQTRHPAPRFSSTVYTGPMNLRGTIRLPIPEADADGLIRQPPHPPVRPETLAIYWLDETHKLWVKLPNSQVNLNEGTVTADSMRHLALYSVMGQASTFVADTYAFPVPFRPQGPNAGTGPGQTGTESTGITFTDLPSVGSIKIFTLSGLLVRDIEISGEATINWDTTGRDGGKLASGTYIYVVESGGNRKKGTLVIIR